MYVRRATPDTYREVLKDIRQKEIYKLIIDTSSQHMSKFFRAVNITFTRKKCFIEKAFFFVCALLASSFAGHDRVALK